MCTHTHSIYTILYRIMGRWIDRLIDRQIDRTACVFLTKRKKEGVEEEVLISDVKCSFYHGWPKNL